MEDKPTYFLVTEFKSSNLIAFLSFLIRAILFVLYFFAVFNIWWLLSGQILVFVFEFFISKEVSKKFKKKVDKLINIKYQNLKIISWTEGSMPEGLSFIFTIMFIIVSFFVFKNEIDFSKWYWYVGMGIGSIVLGTAFLIFNLQSAIPSRFSISNYRFSKGHYDSEKKWHSEDITKDFPDILIVEEETIPFDRFDDNDSKIARMESSLKSINAKVDAYMLESVLLGALAFSGFLTICASNVIAKENEVFKTIYTNISDVITKISSNSFSNVNPTLSNLMARENLFVLIMFESLLCSVFFILVLTLRLRFSNLSLKMDYLIRIMNIFNAKEEELINIRLETNKSNPVIEERQNRISKKIDVTIKDAESLLKQINPIAGLMSGLRNIGITIFVLILATSGLFFSETVFFTILLLAFATLVYRTIESRIKLEKIKDLLRRH